MGSKTSNGHWKTYQGDYFKRQKPITVAKDRQNTDVPVTEKERTALRGLLGALAWPATQTAPHLQATTSLLAGEVTKATTRTLESANKALRYAKANADVGLEYRNIGSKDEVTFVAFSDASFGRRSDHSSQGGFLLLMVSKDVAHGAEGHYNVIDWRSWKLARIARSTLAAESQAASDAADALLFASTFWNLLWLPWLPLDQVETPRMPNSPKLVVDAKALYDQLVRPELQATSGTDKRTTIEVLVTQDKLSCCGGTTMWVSSERQYSDGLTKQSAAQLLADRLRTHLVKLTSDVSFEAAKRKDPKERRKNALMYAEKKPSRALTAMFAMCTMATCGAEEIYIQDNSNHFNYIDFNINLVLMLITMIMALLFGYWWMTGHLATWTRPTTWWRAAAEPEAEVEPLEEDSRPAPETAEIGVGTDLRMGDLVPLYDHVMMQESINETHITREEHERALHDQGRDATLTAFARVQNPIYFTQHGRCWHADYFCLRSQASTKIFQREFCTRCCQHLGTAMEPQDWERTL